MNSSYTGASTIAREHAEHFCRKVARDESYRGGIVKEALAFQKRDRIFERSLAWMDTCVDFGPRSAVAAGPGITAAQGRANLAAMRLAAIRQRVQGLPERQRIAVVMHKYQQMDYQQIAEVLKLSESATKSLLFRAYETLREQLKEFV